MGKLDFSLFLVYKTGFPKYLVHFRGNLEIVVENINFLGVM